MPVPLIAVAAGALLGKALSKGAEGAAKERDNVNAYNLAINTQKQTAHQSDITALLNALSQNENAKLDRAKLGVNAPQARAKQALLGSLMQNYKPISVQAPAGIRVGSVSGGFQGGPGMMEAGKLLESGALGAMRSGSDVPAYTDATSLLTKSPTPTGYTGPGKMESFMGTGGVLLSILAELGAQYNAQKAAGG